MALLDHGEAIPASFRPACFAGLAAQRTILLCGVLQNTGAQHRINPIPMPNMARPSTSHPSSSGPESPESPESPAGGPWQGLRPGGLRGSSGCILLSKLQQPAPGLRDPQGGWWGHDD